MADNTNGSTMHMPRPQDGWKWNVNTLLAVVQLVAVLAGGGYVWANTTRDIASLQDWQGRHDAYHKERMAELRAAEAVATQRLTELDRKVDRLEYRVEVAERSAITISSALRDLQDAFNKQASEIQVMRTILERLEESFKKNAALIR